MAVCVDLASPLEDRSWPPASRGPFSGPFGSASEEDMTKLIAAAFASALLAISAQAMPLAPPQSDDTVTLVREACGAGMHRVNGVCIRTAARRNVGRAAVRCARGTTC